jgi:hypothetical protein
MIESVTGASGRGAAHRRSVVREFVSSALYLAIVLLGVLVALPREELASRAGMVGLVLGTSLGLLLAHWLAFRLASHLTAPRGVAMGEAAQEAGAGAAGGLGVALLASAPFAVLDGDSALTASLVVLAVLPAVTGAAVARLRGAGLLGSVVTGLVVALLAGAVVVVKVVTGH